MKQITAVPSSATKAAGALERRERIVDPTALLAARAACIVDPAASHVVNLSNNEAEVQLSNLQIAEREKET